VFKQASVQRISRDGYIFEEDRPIRIGTKSGYCLRFRAVARSRKVRMSCEVLSAQLSLDFYGNRSEVDTFNSVVARLKAD